MLSIQKFKLNMWTQILYKLLPLHNSVALYVFEKIKVLKRLNQIRISGHLYTRFSGCNNDVLLKSLHEVSLYSSSYSGSFHFSRNNITNVFKYEFIKLSTFLAFYFKINCLKLVSYGLICIFPENPISMFLYRYVTYKCQQDFVKRGHDSKNSMYFNRQFFAFRSFVCFNCIKGLF